MGVNGPEVLHTGHFKEELEAQTEITYFAMADRILKTFIRKLAFITSSVPELDEKGVPWWAVCLVEDVCCAPSVIELKKVGAIPRFLIEFAFFRIQVIRSPLQDHPCREQGRYAGSRMLGDDPIYLVVANDRVQIDQRRVWRVGRSFVMSGIDMRCIAVIVSVPREIRRGEGGIVYSCGRAYTVIDGDLSR